MRPNRRPTRATCARRVSDLLAALAVVYAEDGLVHGAEDHAAGHDLRHVAKRRDGA